MPRTALPPTPQSSTDIVAKPAPALSGLELSFTLPPPALGSIVPADSKAVSSRRYLDSSASTSSSSSSSYRPLSPTSPGIVETENTASTDAPKKRRRSSTLEKPKSQPPTQKRKTEEITLPPPPSRTRKIIQMRPRQSSSSSASSTDGPIQSSPPGTKRSKKTASKSDKAGDDEKPTTAVGRKIARKTAHSLIERRRRFKMNEEFGVLKGMIPACKGVEMHKLAILQASIEYLRYLERCVEDLKASNSASSNYDETHTLMPPPPPRNHEDRDSEDDSEEEEEADEEGQTEQNQVEAVAPCSLPPSMLVSPCLFPASRQVSQSPVTYPQGHQHDPVDTEATHALLLLADGRVGGSDRPRGSPSSASSSSSSSSRGMSVKDLLSA